MASMSLPLPIVSSISTLEPFAGFAQLLFRLARDVVAGLLADGVGHRQAAERRLERSAVRRSSAPVVPFTAIEIRSSNCSVNSIIQR